MKTKLLAILSIFFSLGVIVMTILMYRAIVIEKNSEDFHLYSTVFTVFCVGMAVTLIMLSLRKRPLKK